MQPTRLTLLLLASTVALAGCMGGDQPTTPPSGDGGGNNTGSGNNTNPGGYSIQWTNHPGDADGPASTSAGQLASFTWRVKGPAGGQVSKTQVCWDDASHASAAPAAIATAYNESCSDGFKAATDSSYPLDGDINRQVISPAPGTWYARVWAKAGAETVASTEITWTITEPTTTTVTIPKPLPPSNGEVPVTWRVNGPAATVTETGVVWGPTSVPDGTATGGDTTPVGGATAYTGGKKTATAKDAPATFSASIPTGGTVYYRAYAVVGGTTYWSHEHVA